MISQTRKLDITTHDFDYYSEIILQNFINPKTPEIFEDTIKFLYDTVLCGWGGPRKVRPGRKPQWRWSCSYHSAYELAKALLPYSRTKKKDLEKIVKHYDDNITGLSKLN